MHDGSHERKLAQIARGASVEAAPSRLHDAPGECESRSMKPLLLRRFVPALLGLLLASPLPPRAVAKPAGPLALPGLSEPATVITDRFGLPHVRAASLSDLYYAWGWVTA